MDVPQILVKCTGLILALANSDAYIVDAGLQSLRAFFSDFSFVVFKRTYFRIESYQSVFPTTLTSHRESLAKDVQRWTACYSQRKNVPSRRKRNLAVMPLQLATKIE